MIRYTLAEAGRVLRLSPVTLRSAILRGRMRAEKDERGRWTVDQHAVALYDLQSRGQRGAASAYYRRQGK